MQINITTTSVVRGVLVLAGFFLIYKLIDLVLILITSVVIASAIEPFTQSLEKIGIPRLPSVILIYLFVLLVFSALIFFVFPPFYNEFISLTDDLPEYLQTLDLYEKDNEVAWLKNILPDSTGLSGAFAKIGGGFLQTAGFLFGGIFGFFLIIVISFYLAVQEKGIENFLRLVLPVEHERYGIDLWLRSQRKIGLWLQGQMLLGFIMGVFVYLGLTILGIKYALLLALLTIVFELIPIFGPILAAVPAVAIAASQSLTSGGLVLGFYIILQQFENHLIYPLVVRKMVGVPPLLSILSLIVGAQLAGFLGVILAVPLASALVELINDFEKRKHQ